MATIDETKINSENPVETQSEVKGENVGSEKRSHWREVTLGGISGIVLGLAGGAAGMNVYAKGHGEGEMQDMLQEGPSSKPDIPEIGENVKVAEGVTDEMTFSEAFAEARHDVGAGGAFTWHGQVYSTYYEAEWDAMTDGQKEEYWSSVRGADVVAAPEDEPDGNSDPELVAAGEIGQGSYVEVYDTTGNGQGDVAIIDVENDGKADIVVVDVNNDSLPDIMVYDSNGDGVVDESEVYQVGDDGVVVAGDVCGSAGNDLIEPTYYI